MITDDLLNKKTEDPRRISFNLVLIAILDRKSF